MPIKHLSNSEVMETQIAADVYAKAYGKDQEFYSLTKSLTAYKQTFTGKDDILVLEPDSQFFRYFNQSKAK